MTGLTTSTALNKLQVSINTALGQTPNYCTSPFLTWFCLPSIVLLISWIVCCGYFFNIYVSVILGVISALTSVYFIIDTYLAYKEKINSIKDIMNILQNYSDEGHAFLRSSVSGATKPGFYLHETYPRSTSVSVQRVYRNGKVVSIGTTLLVEGDIILLSPGDTAPAESSSLSGDVKLVKGDIFADKETNDNSFNDRDCVIEQTKLPTLFTVSKTEYQTFISQFLRNTKLPSRLCLEVWSILKVLNCGAVPAVVVLSVVAAIIQTHYLQSGSEVECVLVTLLPLLPTIYPLYYTLIYYISTAKVIQTSKTVVVEALRDPMKTPDHTINNSKKNSDYRSTLKVLELTYKIVTGKLYQYLPRNSNIFGSLSSVTVLCMVNKEGVLSRPNPHVERIMLLDPTLPEDLTESEGLGTVDEEVPLIVSDVESQERSRLFSTMSETDCEREEVPLISQTETSSLPNIHAQSEDAVKKVRSLQGSLIAASKSCCSDVEDATKSLTDVDIELQPKTSEKADRKSAKLWLPKIVSGKRRVIRTTQKDSSAGDLEDTPEEPPVREPTSEINKGKKKKRNFWQMMKAPRYHSLCSEEEQLNQQTETISQSSIALKDDFIVVLNVSLSKHSPFGIMFDCKNVSELHGSLKPVGLAVLLNNNCHTSCHNSPSVTMSHLNYISVQHYCGFTFRIPLPTDYCHCVLGREIGFTRSVIQQYHKQCTILTYVPCEGDDIRRTQRNPADNMTPLTCIMSSVVHDKITGLRHIMSYGTAPFLVSCCTQYWTGTEVQSLQPEHRVRVLEFYNQNRLTSFCYIVAYRPLLGHEYAPQNDVFVSLPKGYGFLDTPCTVPLDSAESYLKLQTGQTLLGVISSQFQPKHDVVLTIERLVAANIRFVHFSYDNELRSRAFGTKLGLETGWNCHISLAEGDFDNFSVDSDSNGTEAETFHFYYCKARLPQGIKNIRPHLENVDNVPLLVPLFTSCTQAAIKEMIAIMQENAELVCCVGSSLQLDNFNIFLQADSSIGMIPHLPQNCLISGIKDMTLPWESHDYRSPPYQDKELVGTNCLHLTSILNTIPCSIVMPRDNMGLEDLIRSARTVCVSFEQSGHLAISMSLGVSLWCLTHQLLLLPPPLTLPGCVYVCLFVVPLLSSTPFTVLPDNKIMELHTGKRLSSVTGNVTRHLKHFVVRWSTLFFISPIITILSLYLSCKEECKVLVGSDDRRFDTTSLQLVQQFNLIILTLVLSVNSFIFANRTKSINFPYFTQTFTKWTGIIPLLCSTLTILLTTLYTHLTHHDPTPPYPLVIAMCVLPPLQLALSELSKMCDRKLWTRDQRRAKLKFGTKLGMNSPF